MAMWEELDQVNRYRTILLDPPWPMRKMIPEGADRSLIPSRHSVNLDYPTMTVEQIRRLPLADLMEPNCHVYLWTTQRFLPDALELFRSWGITYHCVLTWVKQSGIVPFSFCFNTEHMVFGYRGGLDFKRCGLKLSMTERSTAHSVKPEESYQRIEEASFGPYLEMFARRRRPGWDIWGNQVTGSIDL